VGPLIFFVFICCKLLAQCYNLVSLRKDREMINTDQIIQCASDLGYSLSLDDALDVLHGDFDGWVIYEGENVWNATTEWLNIYETGADFYKREFKKIRAKWETVL
jgi:hypothetical protein